MAEKNLIILFLKKYFGLEENKSKDIGNPKRILVVRQHNQFGELLASVSIFRALKETFPNSELSVIVSKENHHALKSNSLIDKLFVFNKKKLFNPFYIIKVIRFLRREYDLAVVPVTVSLSLTSNLLARIADSKIRIGPQRLNDKINPHNYLFDRRIEMDWKKCPDAHVADYGLDILRPFGIKTKSFKSQIDFNGEDEYKAEKFITKTQNDKKYIVGFHVGAGKPTNRWSLDKYISLINKINENYDVAFYFTGSDSDNEELNYIRANLDIDAAFLLNRSIPELAAVISKSDLFITNDNGVMHVAGSTDIKQISIFGPTNPFNWAPLGATKYFVRKKSGLIDDVTVEEVYNLFEMLIKDEE